MEKRILNYRKFMEELLAEWEKNGAWGGAGEIASRKKEHLTQIAFFAHERLAFCNAACSSTSDPFNPLYPALLYS